MSVGVGNRSSRWASKRRCPGCNTAVSPTSRRRLRRVGAAVVELAVTLPIFVLLVFGSLALCRDMYGRESLYLAAYETARAAARRGGTEAAAQQVGRQLLEARGFTDAEISILPRPIENLPPGTEIRVRISLLRSNLWNWWRDAARPPTAEVSFVKE